MAMPLVHPPGDVQVNSAQVDIVRCGRVELPHSDDAFVMAFPAEITEFPEGHNQAFAYYLRSAAEHCL